MAWSGVEGPRTKGHGDRASLTAHGHSGGRKGNRYNTDGRTHTVEHIMKMLELVNSWTGFPFSRKANDFAKTKEFAIT